MAKKNLNKSYVRYDIKYSLSLSKAEYIDAVRDYNFTQLEENNKTKYLFMNIGFRVLINLLLLSIVIGILYTLIYVLKNVSSNDNDIDGLIKTVQNMTPVTIFIVAGYTVISEVGKYIRLSKAACSFNREAKAVKKYPKHMVFINDDLVKVARIKFRKQKFVVDSLEFKTWKIRGLIPYTKHGLKNFYLLTTTSTNLPIYIKDKKKAKKLGEIVNGWAK